MLAVGRYISQGVYTVAGPFHPFGGAVDIVVVKQEDGTFKSSPWYVKFGKFQGVLKRREKWVDVAVNDVTAPFHMYLDATGEAYFLKDAESDSEETIFSPPSAVSSGDGTSLEPLAIEAAAAEDGTVIRSQDVSGEEKDGDEESSEQKETKDKGRGVSPLLDQGPAAGGGVTTDIGLPTLSEHEVAFDSALDPENTGPSLRSNEEEPAADGDNEGGVASLELIAAGSKPTVVNGVTVAGLTEGGAAVHILLKKAVGFSEGHGGTARSQMATAALNALGKATAEPSDGLENLPANIDELPSSLEYLDTVGVEESIELPKKRTSLPSLHDGPQCTIHLIRAPTDSVLKGSNSLDSRLTKEQDLELLGNDIEYVASRRPILKSVRSDLGAYQGASSLSTNLMIACADGVIFLEAPTPEVSGESSAVNLQAEEQTPQGISRLQEVEEDELPDISVLTSISELCKKEALDISCDRLECLHDAQSGIEAEQELSLEGEGKHVKSLALLPGEIPHVTERRTEDEEESERDKKVKSNEQHVIDAVILQEQSEARGDPKFVASGIKGKRNITDVPQEDSEAEKETFVQKASLSQLLENVDDVDEREVQQMNIAEAHTTSSGLRNGFEDSKRNMMDVLPVLGLQDSILEKRQRAYEIQEEQDQIPEKGPRTSEQTEVVIGSSKLGDRLVVAPRSEGMSRTCTDEADSSSVLKGLAEQELAWREAMNKTSAALRATPPSAKFYSAAQSLDRRRKLGLSNSPPKRSENQSPPQKSTSPAASDRKMNLLSTSQKSDTSEHAERRSWGWWGWRGGPAPAKPNIDQDSKKGSKVTSAVKEPEQENSKAEAKGQTSTSSPDGKDGPGIVGEKSASSSAVRESDTMNTLETHGLEACGSDIGDSHVETSPEMSRGSKSSDSKERKNGHLLLRTSTSDKIDAKMEQEDEMSDTASSNKPQKPQGRKAEITRRRSILGIVFRGGDQPLPSSDGQSAAELIKLERESSLRRAEIVHDLLENSWGYGKGVKSPVSSENGLVPVGTVISGVSLKGKGGRNEQIKLPDLTAASHVESHATQRSGEKGEDSSDHRGDEAVTRDLRHACSARLENRVGPRASEEVVMDSSKREESSDLLYSIGTSGFPTHLSLNDLAGGNQVEDIKHHKKNVDEGNDLQEESAGSHIESDADGEKACSVAVSDQVEHGLPSKELRYPSASESQDEEDTCKFISIQDERSNSNKLLELLPVQEELVSPCERKKVVSFGTSVENVILSDDPVELSTDEAFEGRPVFEPTASPLCKVVEVNEGDLALLSPTDPVSILENTSENNQEVVGDDKSRSRGEDEVAGTSEKRSPVDREQFLLPNQDVNMEIEATASGVASVLPLALQSVTQARESFGGTHSTKVKLVKTAAVLPMRTDHLATIEAELAEAGETDGGQRTPQEVDELEDEIKNPYEDAGGTSKRSIYYDAITSDDDIEEGQGNSLSEDWESKLSRNKADPISIPGALDSTSFKEVFVIARDRPLSESLPDVRLHYDKAEMVDEEKALSRSVGSEPLALARRSPIVQGSAEGFGGHLDDEVLDDKLRHSCIEVMDSPQGSGRSGDVSAREEDVASDGDEGPVETGFELSLCRHLLKAHMGIEEAAKAFASAKISFDDFRTGGSTVITDDKLILRVGGQYYSWSVAAPIVLGILAFGKFVFPEGEGAIPVERPKPPLESKPPAVGTLVPTASGGWKLWPFPLRRPKTPEKNNTIKPEVSREALLAAAATAVQSPFVNELLLENGYYKRPRKNKVRTIIPSSHMLSQMNLKEGSNIITFTFFTRMLGRQQVDARIYLWKWNTRIVISDVDGTITKSDVLGQVMPLVGKDWTQSGVARLFSAIKDNGYELLFLSARAISQAYLTRQFLFNVKQDGETLPAGPVVISPDGLFPSLYREVIRRAPHEFKIACLQDIRSLFPKDCNPFYAGFGNRDTDEISYLKVGIPKGKIYIINPKGEVAVNNRTDVKTYTSLHKLVNDMFPAQTYNEQEDFNSWNYWKMPLISIDDELKSASSSKT